MKYGICQVSVAALRREALDASEMVSQLLFGEKVTILETNKKWLFVKAEFDEYEGWVDPKQILEISEKEFTSLNTTSYASELYNLAITDNTPMTVPIGGHLPNLENKICKIGNKSFEYLGETTFGKKEKSELISFTQLFLNVPYLWGGKSSFGIDCSGYVQQVFKLCGVNLPRDAYQQAEIGEVLSFVEEAEAGDLAFFDNEEGKIIHIGIVLNNQKIIHAHGKVRIDLLDSTGIFNTEQQRYSHKLRFIRRII